MKGGHTVIALRFGGIGFFILLTIFVMVALFAVPVQAETVFLADQLPAMSATVQAVDVEGTDSGPPLAIEQDTSLVEGLLSMFSALETKMLYIYTFEDSQSCLGASASYRLLELSDDIDLNASAVLISDSGLSVGLGVGLSINSVANVLDTTVGWTPQRGLFIGVGINRIL